MVFQRCSCILVASLVLFIGCNGNHVSSPIGKVVELIKELKGKIQADGKAEAVIYNKMACWCETTTQNKASEIEQAQDDLASLSQAMNTNKGNIATRASDINSLMTDISRNEAKQYAETTKRERQNADYMQNKAELTNAIAALDKAVQMLSGIDHLSFVQGKFTSNQAVMMSTAKSAAMKVVERLPSDTVPLAQLSALEKMGSVGASEYKPFEPTITSILKDLLESFRATQETETTNEGELQTSYQELMGVKGSALETKKASMKQKEDDKARETQELAANAAEWQSTAKELRAANALFGGAKTACTAKANQYNARVEARNEELSGIDDALETLTSDENRALVSRASKDGPGGLDFLQLDMKRGTQAASKLHRAYVAIAQAAKASRSKRVQKIAGQILKRSRAGQKEPADATDADWAGPVISDINDVLSELETDQTTDTETLDNCRDEEQALNLEIDNRTHIIKRYNLKLDKLESKVEDLTERIAVASKDVQDLELMQTQITDERNSENTEFEREKSDDEAAIGVLESAMHDLSKFYDDKGISKGSTGSDVAPASLVQVGKTSHIMSQWEKQREHASSPKKAGFLHVRTQSKSGEPEFEVSDDDMLNAVNEHSFSGEGKRAQASGGIVGLLTIIRDDLSSDVAKSVKIESTALGEYNQMMSDSDQEVSDLNDKISGYNGDKNDREDEIEDNNSWKEQEQSDLDSAAAEMDTLMNAGDEGKDVSFPCTFMYKNYEVRRTRRASESEGLKEGVALLSGMSR